MSDDFTVTGADDLALFAAYCKATGDKGLKRELMRGMQKAGKPLKAVAKEAARDNLPSSGGLNEFVASGTFSVRTRTGGRDPGIRLVGSKRGHDIRAMDRGRLRHPVYGHEWWVAQSITPGWFSQGLKSDRVLPQVRREVMQVLDDVARKIAASA